MNDEVVYVADGLNHLPDYHLISDHDGSKGDYQRTVCGEIIGYLKMTTGERFCLPRKHAKVFGNLCPECEAVVSAQLEATENG